jgi:type IX secretion system PorP/SprF family membrane protein
MPLINSGMKKIFLSISVSLITAIGIKAQQLPHYSQYMLNPYLINPAVGGTSDHYDFKAGYRHQWAGIQSTDNNNQTSSAAPQTFYVTAHGHIGKDHQRLRGRHRNQNSWHHGLGVQFITDRTWAVNNNTFRASYSYDFSLSKTIRLSVGAALGIKSFGIDQNRIRLSDGSAGVGSYTIQDLNRVVPDMAIGFWMYHKLFYFGASVDQLLMMSLGDKTIYKTDINGVAVDAQRNNNVVNRLTQHWFITGGGIFHPSREIAIIPSVLVKSSPFNSGTGVSVDFNAKVRYNNLVWGGLSYRSSDAFVVLVGVLLNKRIEVGYSYDYTLSYLNVVSNGSHEIMVGYRLEPRAHILSPSDFW